MKTMFQMGFSPQLFGPTMGAVRLRSLGDVSVSRDGLLKDLEAARIQLYRVDEFVSKYPDLPGKLGADYQTFQSWQFGIQGSREVAEAVLERLDDAEKGTQATLSAEEESAVRTYKSGAAVLSDLVAKYSPRIDRTGPAAAAPAGGAASGALPVNDLGPALLVGGGVLAIGVIAILVKG